MRKLIIAIRQPSSRMSPRPMKNSPAALSSRDGEPATAASDLIAHSSEPTLAGTGGNPGQGDGHPRGDGHQADEHEDEHRFSGGDLNVSFGDLFGGRYEQGQRREVRRHGEHAERKRRPGLARTTRAPGRHRPCASPTRPGAVPRRERGQPD